MSEEINEFKINKFTPSKSIYIEASAGTGKTYTIQLIVARMLAEGTPLKKILIVTYTEKPISARMCCWKWCRICASGLFPWAARCGFVARL